MTILYPQKYKSSWANYTDYKKLSHNDVEIPVSKKGIVKARKVGTCTITVISKDGHKKAKSSYGQ